MYRDESRPTVRMDHPDARPVVNSHNGWAPLEEVIVGAPFHLDYDNDVSFRLFFFDNLGSELDLGRRGAWRTSADPEMERRLNEELAEDTAEFVDLLEAEHVVVRRPNVPTKPAAIQTPDWATKMGHSLMPRDLFLTIGDEIIETAPMVRSRYLESHLYYEILTAYFDRGARWTAAPRSRLLERNFDFEYVLARGYANAIPDDPCYEIMFDGAQVIRIGRDLVFNCSTENHRMGMRWLGRHLGEGYRMHEVNITDSHVDAKVVPLRPGTLLLHEDVSRCQLPAFLRSWNVIRYTPTGNDIEDRLYGARPVLASKSLGMNVLSLDEERVVVQDAQTDLIKDLENAGFTPITCRWRHGRIVGGAFHCMTLDVRRRSVLEDYT